MSLFSKAIYLCALSTVLLGCLSAKQKYPHVTLQLPSEGASVQERAEAYKKLRTDKTKFTATTTSIDVKPIRLEDGTEVFLIEDLLPLVPSNSKTGKKINDALESYQKGQKKIRQGVALSLVGSFIFLPSILIPNRAVAIAAGVSGGTLAVFGMIRTFSGSLDQLYYFGKSQEIVYTLNNDILTQLSLCVFDQKLVDCSEVR